MEIENIILPRDLWGYYEKYIHTHKEIFTKTHKHLNIKHIHHKSIEFYSVAYNQAKSENKKLYGINESRWVNEWMRIGKAFKPLCIWMNIKTKILHLLWFVYS